MSVMNKKIVTSVLLLTICLSAFARLNIDLKNKYQITGKIIEASSQKAIPYASILVFANTKDTVTVKVSDILGHFSLTVKHPGNYMMKFEAMGYGTDTLSVNVSELVTDIGVIALEEGQQLSGVIVSAQKLIMKQEIDKLIYDVTKDPEAKRLKMADIMKKIPFMTINGLDGKLKYIDNKISKILINGKPNDMISGSRQFPMHLIKGDVMKNIEIILPGTKDNPGDKPIININLARELPNGYSAEFSANGNTQNLIDGTIDVITKMGDLYLSVNYGMNYQNRPKLESYTTKENFNEDAIIYLQNNKSTTWGHIASQKLGIGASYGITKKDKISLSLSTNKSLSKNYVNSLSKDYNHNDVLIGYHNSNSINRSNSTPKINGSFNYRHTMADRSFISASYYLTNDFNNSDYSMFTSNYGSIKPNHQITTGENSTLDQSATFLFSKRYGNKHFIEANANYTNRQYSNSSEIELWNYDNQSLENYSFNQDGLEYNQHVYRASGRYNLLLKKLSLNLNLSTERMINKGLFISTQNSKLDYNELNLFPSISLVYRTKHRYKVGIKYKTRTLRPNINYLNPYINNSDPKNIIMGNPNLKAEYAHNIEFTVDKLFGNSTMLSFFSSAEFINNAIEKVTTIDNNSISTTTYENIDKRESYFARVSLFMSLLRRITIANSVRVRYAKYSNSLTGMQSNTTGFGYWGTFSVKLSKTSNIEGSVNVSPQNDLAQTKEVKYATSFDLNFYQTIVKDKLFLTLSVEDPHKKHRFISNTIGNNSFNMTTSRERAGRVFGFRLLWNFGRLKDKGSMQGDNFEPSDLSRPELPIK